MFFLDFSFFVGACVSHFRDASRRFAAEICRRTSNWKARQQKAVHRRADETAGFPAGPRRGRAPGTARFLVVVDFILDDGVATWPLLSELRTALFGYCQRPNSLVLELGVDSGWIFLRSTTIMPCLLEIRVIVAGLGLSVESAVVDTLRIRLLCHLDGVDRLKNC
jgi:hypothetical protein